MNEALDCFWKRADLAEPVFRHDDLGGWPVGFRETLENNGVLRRHEDAQFVSCDACSEQHFAEIVRDPKYPDLPYYRCPALGPVNTAPLSLRRWGVAFERLAAFLHASLSLAGKVTEIVPGRVWSLGSLNVLKKVADVFLFRGAWWPDAAEVLSRCLRLRQNSSSLVLVTRRFPSEEVWGDRRAIVLALAELTDVDQSGMVIARQRLTAAASGIGMKALDPLKVDRSIGSEAAVEALLALKKKKGWTMEELARQVGTTARTLQEFKKSRQVRNSVFRTMAQRLEITPEDLLAGSVPGAR